MRPNGVVCYIRDNGRVLLPLKPPGRFGGGWWNAPGGKLVDGETPLDAAVREVREETGLTVRDLREHGSLTFYFGDAPTPDFTVFVFSTTRFEGTVTPSDEGDLAWFEEGQLPYDNMWADDTVWLPHVLAGRRVEGVFRLSDDHKRLLEHELRVDP
jgi:8-oxo-dGTP diphosphatase